MGTQQILLIVLSVIIVGVAIAVGISMFNSQAYNSNRTAIASDAQGFAAQVVQFYKTPQSQGGFGSGTAVDGEGEALTLDDMSANLYSYLGFNEDGNASNENGLFFVEIVDDNNVNIKGIGTAAKGLNSPTIITAIALPAGTMTATAGEAATGTAPEDLE